MTKAQGGPHRLTIDLDGLWCYRQIHGVTHAEEPRAAVDDDVLLLGLPRFLEMCALLSTKATLFVVGLDLRNARYARLIEDAARAGHDVMSHSHSHAYDLSRWSRRRMGDDVRASVAAIKAVTGVAPAGFRAPGYNLSKELIDVVKDTGLSWSSSLMPSPAYFAARAAIILSTTLRGGRSASLFGDPRAFGARGQRAQEQRHANGLREYPLSAAWGIPFTGTMLALLPDSAGVCLTEGAVKNDDVQLELHAADFVEGSLLPPGQPERAVPLALKLARLQRAARRVID